MSEREIFMTARAISDPSARAMFLTEACAGDVALRERVERLLHADAMPDSLLDAAPAVLLDTDRSKLGSWTPPREADFTPEESLRFLAPPQQPGTLGRIHHYDVLELVGRGGMGLVLKAFDTRLQRLVAIKVMAPSLAISANARKRFVREAQAGAAVNHRHVVTLHAVEAAHNPPYLVMEFVAGRSLEDKVRQEGPPDANEIVRLGREIAEGLAAAHACGLIHRDIKPANILLEVVGHVSNVPGGGTLETCPPERVKITDFGLARVANDARLTQSGVVAGTPRYMSPEQALGQPLDARSDLFSLGGVLYFLCTAQPPFRAGNTLAVLSQVIRDEPQPIRELNPAVPQWLCDVVAKLQAKDAPQRIQTAQEVVERLAAGGAGVPAGGAESPDPHDRGRRSRVWLAVIGVALGVLSLAAVLLSNQSVGRPPIRQTMPIAGTVPPFSPASLTDRDAFRTPVGKRLRHGIPRDFSSIPRGFSPDGKWLATVSDGDRAVRIWDVATGKQHKELPCFGDLTRGPTFSPDAAWLAVYGGNGVTTLWDTRTFTPGRTLEQQPERIRSAAFDTEDRILATGREDGRVQFWEVATGRKTTELSVSNFPVLGLDFLPGNKRLAVFTPERPPMNRGELDTWHYDCVIQVLDLDEQSSTFKQIVHQWKAPDTHFLQFMIAGDQLYFMKNRYKRHPLLCIADAGTGALREIRSLPGVVPVSLLPFPGRGLLVAYADKVARFWNTETAEVEWEVALPSKEDHASLALHPDGVTVAFGADDLTRVQFFSLITRNEIVLP